MGKYFGITVKGIEYYERKGLITPKRVGSSKQRRFDLSSTYQLFMTKYLRQAGMDIDDTLNVLNSKSIQDVNDSFANLLEALKHKQQKLNAVIKVLRHNIDLLNRTKDDSPFFEVIKSPEFKRLFLREMDEPHQSNQYQTLDNLNHAWWNTFWSHTFTDWSQITAPSPRTELGSKGMNLDWRRFITDQTISFIDNETAPLKKITPNIPVTTNMMAGNPLMDPFTGFDYQKVAQHLDIISWDSYPAWDNDYQTTEELGRNVGLIHDFFRSLKHQNFMVMENTPSKVNWQEFNRAKRPGMNELASLQDIAHGSDSVLYFQLRASRGSAEMFHGAVLEHRHPEQTRVYHEVSRVGHDLAKLKPLFKTSYAKAKVAIVYSYDNFWALSDAESFMKDKKIWQTIQAHYRYFYDHDIAVDFVSPTDDFSQYRLIIDPMHFMMSQNYIDKLYDFVQKGGKVVGAYISGVVDENGLAYMNEWPKKLQKIYGIEPLETDTLYPKQHNIISNDDGDYQVHDFCEVLINHGAQEIAKYCEDFYQGKTAVTKNQCGKGMGYYLACRTDADFLQDFYSKVASDLKVDYPIKKNSTAISIQKREDEDNQYLFVQNFSDTEQKIELKENMKELLGHSREDKTVTLKGYETKVYQV